MRTTAKYPYQIGDEPVPGYRIMRLLGKGGFGKVWEAKAPGGARVAIKVIPDLSRKLARKEFRALAIVKDIRHSNLVSINAFWLKDGEGKLLEDSLALGEWLPREIGINNPLVNTATMPPQAADPSCCELIIAMSLGQQSLFERMNECREEGASGIPVEELLNYMDDAARAIDYLNSECYVDGTKRAGVQHCDIKPQNILVVGTSAQVCDFGLARVQGETRATSSLTATIAYAAPECLEKAGDPSPTTDQYSLAISYYELKTGRLPYQDGATHQMLKAILAGRLDFSGITTAEAIVLRKATARVPSQRFPSSVAMLTALRRSVESPAGSGSRLPVSAPRHQGRILLWLMIASVGGAFARWTYDRQMSVFKQDDAARLDAIVPVDVETRDFDPAKASTAKQIAVQQQKALGVDHHPETAETYLQRARRRRQANEFAGAAEDCLRVIEEFPDHAVDAYLERGACARDQGRFSQAIDDLSEVIRLAPNNALAFSRRGYIYLKLKRFDAALVDLNEAIRLDPHDLDHLNRGIVFSTTGKSAEAFAEFSSLIERDPDNEDAFYQRALVYRDQGKFGEAIADFRSVLRIEPDNANALALLAKLLACGPDATALTAIEAAKLARQACSLSDGKEPSHLDALAAALAKNGDFAQAVEAAEKAVRAADGSPEEPIYRARLELYKVGKPFVFSTGPPSR